MFVMYVTNELIYVAPFCSQPENKTGIMVCSV
jgi:hypothetical protein